MAKSSARQIVIRSENGHTEVEERAWRDGELVYFRGRPMPPPPPPPSITIRYEGKHDRHDATELHLALTRMGIVHTIKKASNKKAGVYDVDDRYLSSMERFERFLLRLGVVE